MRRRVPLVLQQADADCAAACLAMVILAWGGRTTLDACRTRCAPGRGGSTARQLAAAARSVGLSVRALTAEPEHLRDLPTPLVVHWAFDHFVVVERWHPRYVDIVDPASGRRRVDPDAFDRAFTGVVLSFTPGPAFGRDRDEGGRFSWTARIAALGRIPGVRGALAQIVAASALLQLAGLAVPAVTKVVVDEVLGSGAVALVPMLAAGAALAVCGQAVATGLRGVLLVRLQARIDAALVGGFFTHLLSLPWAFFQGRSSGDLLARLHSNLTVREVLTSRTTSALFDLLVVGTTLAILAAWAPWFFLAVAVLGGLQAAIQLGTMPPAHRLTQREIAAQAASQGYLVEALTSARAVKAAGFEHRVLDRWTALFHEQIDAQNRSRAFDSGVGAWTQLVRGGAPSALLLLGTVLVLDGRMTAGSMLALLSLSGACLAPLSSLMASAQGLQVVWVHLQRLRDVLEAEPERDGGAAPDGPGEIVLDEVRFRYPGSDTDALTGISLRIAPGEKVAVVGPSGSGKSTLAMLLLGLHRPTAGSLTVDGRTMDELDLRALRAATGVVLQGTFLFAGTIRDNLALADPGAPLSLLEEAARIAGIHHEIEAMPLGYHTRIGENGSGLSGGQQQRLALARALVHRPRALLLDEATSHLDTVTERRIDAALDALGTTRVVIAHRLSTVRNADRIVVLDRGTIVEMGTHEALVARRGSYAALVQGQEVRETEALPDRAVG